MSLPVLTHKKLHVSTVITGECKHTRSALGSKPPLPLGLRNTLLSAKETKTSSLVLCVLSTVTCFGTVSSAYKGVSSTITLPFTTINEGSAVRSVCELAVFTPLHQLILRACSLISEGSMKYWPACYEMWCNINNADTNYTLNQTPLRRCAHWLSKWTHPWNNISHSELWKLATQTHQKQIACSNMA